MTARSPGSSGTRPRTGGIQVGGAAAPTRAATRASGRAPGHAAGRASGRASGRSPGRGSGWGAGREDTVSSTSAQRFADRVRRRRRRRIGLLAGALVFGLTVGWVLFASPFLSVQQVRLRGLHRVPALQVRAAADPEMRRPMALISPQAVAERVVRLPLVLSARVDRSWPMTLVITVVEREPIAAVPSPGAGFDLRDPDGIVVDHVDTVPPGLPVLIVDVDKAGPAALRAARQVSDALPPTLRALVRRISASSEDAVTLTLTDGSTVLWGSAQDSASKVTALLAVHPKPVSRRITIDVSAPDAPAVTSS